MKQSAFKHYSLNQAKRNQLTINRFTGVDYSTQKFLIADGKAIDLKNYIYKDGVVQKRHGYEHLFTVENFNYVPSRFDVSTEALVEEVHINDDLRINGLWQFKAEDGEIHVIAHIGKLLYEIVDLGTDYVRAEPFTNGTKMVAGSSQPYYLAFEFENYKSFAFVGGNKLWFLGGNKYMCLRFNKVNGQTIRDFFAVENSEHTPIPVTTISITYKNSVVSKRMSLDNVNLLNKWRKNKFISGTTKNEDEKTKTTFFEYTLDAPLIVQDEKDMAGVSMVIEEQGGIE